MDKVGLAIIGSTGIIGRVHIEAMRGLDTCPAGRHTRAAAGPASAAGG